jgi:hypothetical protein
MPKTIPVNRKSRGRPRVDATLVGVRFPPPELSKLDEWIADQHDEPSRPEAVRRLVERGLSVKRKGTKALRPDQLNAENDG